MARFSENPETCFVFNMVGYCAILEVMDAGGISDCSQLVAIG